MMPRGGRRMPPVPGSVREERQAVEREDERIDQRGEQPEAGADPDPTVASQRESELEQRLRQVEEELEEWKDRALRARADFENYRRRALLDAENLRRYAGEGIISSLLPALENFERALAAADAEADFAALRDGVEIIHRQLTDTLAAAGLTRIQAVGRPFDPNLHEAVAKVPAGDGVEPNTVVEELRPGYLLYERVLRPAVVTVATGPD